MDNEQQIVEDILDSIYGVNVTFKGDDEKTVALRNEKRNEKRTELLIQIDSICNAIAKELETALGIKGIDIQKDIKPSVLVTLKAEAENKNIIMDSNGKINTGKFLDIVNQSKDEILEVIENEKDVEAPVYKEEDKISENQSNEIFEKIFEDLSDAGLDLNETERKELQEIISEVNAILSEIQQSIDSGMTLEEAWNKKREEVGEEEFKKIKEKFKVVGKTICVTNREKSKREDQENNSDSKDMDESSRTTNADKPSKTTSSNENRNGESRTTPKFNGKKDGIVLDMGIFTESCFYIEGIDDQTINYDNPAGGDNIKDISVYYDIYKKGVGKKIDKLISDKEYLESLKTQYYQIDSAEEGSLEQSEIFNQGDTNQENFQRYMDTTNLFDSFLQANMGATRVPDAPIKDLIERKGVDMRVDFSALPKIDSSTLATETHEQRHLVIGLEEVTVDGAAMAQGESLEEPLTNRTINGDTLTSLVEGQGTVRDIVDANGMVQGLTSLEKSPEIPTEGKTDTQNAPVANNGDKGEDGPGEL